MCPRKSLHKTVNGGFVHYNPHWELRGNPSVKEQMNQRGRCMSGTLPSNRKGWTPTPTTTGTSRKSIVLSSRSWPPRTPHCMFPLMWSCQKAKTNLGWETSQKSDCLRRGGFGHRLGRIVRALSEVMVKLHIPWEGFRLPRCEHLLRFTH